MKCLHCGGRIDQNETTCRYCGYSIEESKKEREKDDKYLEKIDLVYGLKKNYNDMKAEELNKFFDEIEKKFDADEKKNCYTQEQLDKIMDHILQVNEAVQRRNPIRKESQCPLPRTCNTTSECIKQVLSWKKPAIYMAGANIRSSVDCQIQDYYHIPTENRHYKQSIKNHKSKWGIIFKSILKDKKDIKQCIDYHKILDWFVHSSQDNDSRIKDACVRHKVKNEKELLLKILDFYKSHNLIYENKF